MFLQTSKHRNRRSPQMYKLHNIKVWKGLNLARGLTENLSVEYF